MLQFTERGHRVAGKRLPRARSSQSTARQSGEDILLTGSASVAAALTDLGLLDEYHVIVHPVILGGGKPVYHPVKERLLLELTESRIFDNRTVLLRHDLVRA